MSQATTTNKTIPMTVATLAVDPFTSLPVVILKDALDDKRLAICIGLGEASAIAAEIDNIELERPMTHHLAASLIARTGARVVRVEVCDLVDSTYFARIHLQLDSGDVVVEDARPSDALALALHTGAEIHVSVRVVEEAAICAGVDAADAHPHDVVFVDRNAPLANDGLDRLGDEAFGKWKM